MHQKRWRLVDDVALLAAAAVAVVVALALLAAAPAAQVDPPPTSGQLTISASPNPVTFGRATTVSGRLKKGPVQAAVPVMLQENPAPFAAGFQDIATTTTDADGRYRFTDVRPELNTRYRTRTTVPETTSAELLVEVRMKVVLRLSDRTPLRGQIITFSGTVSPEHDGRLVSIQRRTRTGNWKTVKRAVVKDAGSEFSKFTRRIRARHDNTYRARVYRHADHLDGISRRKRTNVIGI
jgi:thermitase